MYILYTYLYIEYVYIYICVCIYIYNFYIYIYIVYLLYFSIFQYNSVWFHSFLYVISCTVALIDHPVLNNCVLLFFPFLYFPPILPLNFICASSSSRWLLTMLSLFSLVWCVHIAVLSMLYDMLCTASLVLCMCVFIPQWLHHSVLLLYIANSYIFKCYDFLYLNMFLAALATYQYLWYCSCIVSIK